MTALRWYTLKKNSEVLFIIFKIAPFPFQDIVPQAQNKSSLYPGNYLRLAKCCVYLANTVIILLHKPKRAPDT